jgi:hypothetical protein
MSAPKPPSDDTAPSSAAEPEPLRSMDIDQWVENLKRADRSFYNIMALEVWSIAKTMDGLAPGFWNRFMTNRKMALQQFMQQKKSQSSSPGTKTETENQEASE